VQKSAIFIHSLYAKIVWGENSYKDFEVCYYIFFFKKYGSSPWEKYQGREKWNREANFKLVLCWERVRGP
jgi:hypothetical protein